MAPLESKSSAAHSGSAVAPPGSGLHPHPHVHETKTKSETYDSAEAVHPVLPYQKMESPEVFSKNNPSRVQSLSLVSLKGSAYVNTRIVKNRNRKTFIRPINYEAWDEQIKMLRKCAKYDFSKLKKSIIPGGGAPIPAAGPQTQSAADNQTCKVEKVVPRAMSTNTSIETAKEQKITLRLFRLSKRCWKAV